MDERFPVPGWFLRPENWAHQIPQAFLGAPPVWPGPSQSIAPQDLSPSGIPFAGGLPGPTPPDQPLWAHLPSERQGPRQVPTTVSSNNTPATSEPPAVPKDLRTRLLEALSDKNIRYYAGPGFSEFLEKLAGLATLLPGSGTVQGAQDSARAANEFSVGNYGKAAVDLATATANTALDWLPAGKIAMLGGVMGRTFPWAKLPMAEAMEKAGRSVDEIWRETGLARAADGKWRYEISDRGYRINPNAGYLDDEGYRVAHLFDHYNYPGVRQAYPDLSSVISKIRINPKDLGKRGSFDARGTGTITIETPSRSEVKYKGTHEISHLIGKREGHARGGSPFEFSEPGMTYDQANALYQRLAGEVEAENTAYRAMYMTDREKLFKAPIRTEDVPRPHQMIRWYRDKY